MSLSPQNPTRFMHLVDQTIDRFCRMPAPKETSELPLADRFHLSVILADIEEAQAKLETYRVQEVEVRAILVAALGTLAYRAEEAKFRIETGQWNTPDDLRDFSNASFTVSNARYSHKSISALIAGVKDELKEAQKAFDAVKAGKQ